MIRPSLAAMGEKTLGVSLSAERLRGSQIIAFCGLVHFGKLRDKLQRKRKEDGTTDGASEESEQEELQSMM